MAREVASEFGVDLTSHTSEVLSSGEIGNFDVVFLMDISNYLIFRQIAGMPESNVFLLGGLMTEGNELIQIRDPHDGGIDDFREVYEEISLCIDNLIALIEDD